MAGEATNSSQTDVHGYVPECKSYTTEAISVKSDTLLTYHTCRKKAGVKSEPCHLC